MLEFVKEDGIALIEFAENPEPRCACVLLLDTSSSMGGQKIEALNKGLKTFEDALKDDEIAKKRVEVAVVTFDSEVKIIQDFVTADEFQAPELTAQGLTHTGAGIMKALDLIQERKKIYKEEKFDVAEYFVQLKT